MGFKTCSQKYINILANLYLHIWLIAQTWLNFLVDDLEEDYKTEKIIDVINTIAIYNSSIFLK